MRIVGRSAFMSSPIVLMERMKLMHPPWQSGRRMLPVKEYVWKKGRTARKLSSLQNFTGTTAARVSAAKLPWVRMTPFGEPVVPEV